MMLQKIEEILAYFYLRLKKIIFGLSTYSREKSWGVALSCNHIPPSVSKEVYKLLKDNNAFYIGKFGRANSCYLTFDCEDDRNGNADFVLNFLAEKSICATFFVTQKFIVDFPDVVTRMKREGHIVGNHTAHHTRLSLMCKKKIVHELCEVEKTMKELTGYDIDKVFRFPLGYYSIRSIKIIKKCGYASFFWSFVLPISDKRSSNLLYALNTLARFHHSEMIILFHIASLTDRKLLPHYVDFLKQLHYNFAPVAAS